VLAQVPLYDLQASRGSSGSARGGAGSSAPAAITGSRRRSTGLAAQSVCKGCAERVVWWPRRLDAAWARGYVLSTSIAVLVLGG
jgi:hypothetical protein